VGSIVTTVLWRVEMGGECSIQVEHIGSGQWITHTRRRMSDCTVAPQVAGAVTAPYGSHTVRMSRHLPFNDVNVFTVFTESVCRSVMLLLLGKLLAPSGCPYEALGRHQIGKRCQAHKTVEYRSHSGCHVTHRLIG
jgi:hypothetical protein